MSQTSEAKVENASAKRAKFIKLAEKRTAHAIKAIRLIGNLGNRAAYEFGDIDVRKIISALTTEVETVKTKMTTRDGKGDVEFRL